MCSPCLLGTVGCRQKQCFAQCFAGAGEAGHDCLRGVKSLKGQPSIPPSRRPSTENIGGRGPCAPGGAGRLVRLPVHQGHVLREREHDVATGRHFEERDRPWVIREQEWASCHGWQWITSPRVYRTKQLVNARRRKQYTETVRGDAVGQHVPQPPSAKHGLSRPPSVASRESASDTSASRAAETNPFLEEVLALETGADAMAFFARHGDENPIKLSSWNVLKGP